MIEENSGLKKESESMPRYSIRYLVRATTRNRCELPNYCEQNDELVVEMMMLTKVQSRVIQCYDLNMRRRRASVTIRVRQSGHSRDEDMMRSEQLRHIAKWLQKMDWLS